MADSLGMDLRSLEVHSGGGLTYMQIQETYFLELLGFPSFFKEMKPAFICPLAGSSL